MARKRKAELVVDSSDDDASYEPKKARQDDDDWKPQKKSKATTKVAGKGKGKTGRGTSNAEYMEEAGIDSAQSDPHPVSLHVMTRPEPLREAILEWYEGVHASRGMPWRKPYDPSWNAEQKAQRAYEVGEDTSVVV